VAFEKRPLNRAVAEKQLMKPHRATLILVFGILSLVVCAPLGIFAWIMGNADLKEMAAGQMDPSGRETTNIGKILGIIGTVLLVLGIIFGVIMMIVAFGAAAVSSTQGSH
jgi:hypothetical protein